MGYTHSFRISTEIQEILYIKREVERKVQVEL